jgi:NhaP-type Na+/H+ or K+/H+ antiporter
VLPWPFRLTDDLKPGGLLIYSVISNEEQVESLRINDPALTIALALGVGIVVQAIARHLRIPGIALLLGAGVLLGPDFLGIVVPDSLGQALQTLVGFAVAIILFEGGMNLDVSRLRREALVIRRLVTVGALVTMVGGTLCAKLILGWAWIPSILFGTLVIVTGPTVITPLLRRLRVNHKLATVLEAEGVLVDAVGAVVAVVALEVAISPSGTAMALAGPDLLLRMGFGTLVGIAGGFVIALALRIRGVVPEGLENVFALGLALVVFQLSHVFVHESGIVAVVVAGLVVGNIKTRALGDLREFKEQLTVMMIGMLFVLLAADVRIVEVQALGWAGVLTVIALMFIVRPLNVLAGTYGSDLTVREKLFLSWMGPRGIVAAAIASLFSQELSGRGIEGGQELRAMVFLVIVVTVLVQGVLGGMVAQLLRVRRPLNNGYVILGANEVGLLLGRLFREAGHEVVFIDSNADKTHEAEVEGFRALFGTGFAESVLLRAELDDRAGCVAVTPNEEVNLLFARRAQEFSKIKRVWVALQKGHLSVTKRMVKRAEASVLFVEPRDIELWALRLARKTATIECWRRISSATLTPEERKELYADLRDVLLPVAVRRSRQLVPVDEQLMFRKKDELFVVVSNDQCERAHNWLHSRGWELLGGRS